MCSVKTQQMEQMFIQSASGFIQLITIAIKLNTDSACILITERDSQPMASKQLLCIM